MRQGSPGHGEDLALVEFMFTMRTRLYRKVIVFSVMALGTLQHTLPFRAAHQVLLFP
ncbi:MAG: hypothetical protein NZ578_00025 [Candidatus Binatia bacterium]|nr:hypothetical protein [Candidatus Binatia bacterium]